MTTAKASVSGCSHMVGLAAWYGRDQDAGEPGEDRADDHHAGRDHARPDTHERGRLAVLRDGPDHAADRRAC